MSTSTTFDIESMLDTVPIVDSDIESMLNTVPIVDIENFDFKTYLSFRKDEELKKIAEEAKQIAEEAKQIAEEAKKRELEEIELEEKISTLMLVMKCERRMAEIIIIEAEKVATKELLEKFEIEKKADIEQQMEWLKTTTILTTSQAEVDASLPTTNSLSSIEVTDKLNKGKSTEKTAEQKNAKKVREEKREEKRAQIVVDGRKIAEERAKKDIKPKTIFTQNM